MLREASSAAPLEIALSRDEAGGAPVYQQIADADPARDRADGGSARASGCRRSASSRARLDVHRDTVAPRLRGARARRASSRRAVGRGTFVRGRRAQRARAAGAARRRALAARSSACSSSSARGPRYRERAATRCRCTRWCPTRRSIPVDAFRRALNRVLADGGAALLALRRAAGAPRPARGAGRAAARAPACWSAPSGSCSATARARASRSRCASSPTPGDVVAVEEPTYHNVLAALAGPRAARRAGADARRRPRPRRARARAARAPR